MKDQVEVSSLILTINLATEIHNKINEITRKNHDEDKEIKLVFSLNKS